MENYKCQITIDNGTSLHLRLLKEKLEWGIYEQNPVNDIMPETATTAFKACGRPNLPGGCEGNVWYQLGDDANKNIKIYFEVTATPGTKNTVKVEPSNRKIGATLSGFNGEGSVENCTITVVGG